MAHCWQSNPWLRRVRGVSRGVCALPPGWNTARVSQLIQRCFERCLAERGGALTRSRIKTFAVHVLRYASVWQPRRECRKNELASGCKDTSKHQRTLRPVKSPAGRLFTDGRRKAKNTQGTRRPWRSQPSPAFCVQQTAAQRKERARSNCKTIFTVACECCTQIW